MTATTVGPDFIGVGVQKCATTWIADVLAQHPQIIIRRKEVNFFVRHFHRGHGWYRHWFENRGSHRAGEITPNYIISPRRNRASKQFYPTWFPRGEMQFWRRNVSARDEIANEYPNAKVFAIFRDPVSRAWSHYWMWRNRRECINKKTVEFRKMFDDDGRWIQTTGRYADHLAYWLEKFPDMGIYFYDDLKNDRIALAQEIYRFVDVDDSFEPEEMAKQNKGRYDSMPEEDRAALIEVYRDQIERFADMVGRDLSHWLEV